MKYLLSLSLTLCSLFAWGQQVFTENFADGDFTQNPPWQGDTALFRVSQQRLQLQDTAAGRAYLSTPVNLINNARWTITFELDFNPSGSNYARFYLMSDQANLAGGLNGYYLRLGGSSADKVSLYRQTGAASTLVCESPADWLDLDPVKATVAVSRSAGGFWRLEADTGSGLVALDSALDATHTFSTHVGWRCHYTKTRADKFFVDSLQVSGFPFTDTLAPRLDSLRVSSANSLALLFSESLDQISAEEEKNYSVTGLGNPALAVLDAQDTRRVSLSFTDTFVNKQLYWLRVNGVSDRVGNRAQDSLSFRYVVPQEGDVVLNEIMFDPNPVVGTPPNALPEREYLELYNQSALDLNLRDYVLEAGNSTATLPDYLLPAGGYVVLTKDEGLAEFPPGTPLLGLDLSSVALTNGGATVTLRSPQQIILSTVSYRPEWFRDPNKAEGGWSLEQIDPQNICSGATNWRGSVSAVGGTPGYVNSVAGLNPDTVPPAFQRITLPGDSAMLLFFTERLAPGFLEKSGLYQFNAGLSVNRVTVLPTRDRVLLQLNQPLQPQELYKLWLAEWPNDCAGNTMAPDTLTFGLPAAAEKGDLVINELLFNPYTGGSDFVEIYNASAKIIDLATLRMGNWDPIGQSPLDLEPLLSVSYLMYPGDHLALTESLPGVLPFYENIPEGALVPVADLPSMPDGEGTVCLTSANFEVLDAVAYQEDWHLQVLDQTEGVSLERIRYTGASQDPNNWLSAAAADGYATPGRQNSQWHQPMPGQAKLSLSPKVFSPNQDGYHDFVSIQYQFPQGGQVVSVRIFTVKGQLLTTLSTQEPTAQTGTLTWDGTTRQGQLAQRGPYLVVMDYFNPNGSSGVVKETVVLSR